MVGIETAVSRSCPWLLAWSSGAWEIPRRAPPASGWQGMATASGYRLRRRLL